MPKLNRLRRTRNKRPPAPIPPRGIILEYFREMRMILAYARGLVKARLMPELASLLERSRLDGVGPNCVTCNMGLAHITTVCPRHDGAHFDALPPGKKANKIMDRVSAVFFKKYTPEKIERLAERIGRATSEHQKDQLFRQVKVSLGISLDSITDVGLGRRISAFTAANVALIETIPQTYFDQVEKVVHDGMREGARHEDLARDIAERFDVSNSRAALIARDQVLKFEGELDKARQESLGVESYVWRTVNDDRVRPEHEELEGQVFRWDDPPEEGPPGTAILCRCYAEPLFPDQE